MRQLEIKNTTYAEKVQVITNKVILSFFWKHIKPYKWFYLLMLLGPIVGSFYTLAYNFAVKLFLDGFEAHSTDLTYKDLLIPIIVFVLTQLILDIAWRISQYAEWKGEPYVRRSIIVSSYDHVQNHSYAFFQNHFVGSISSKLKGIVEGYEFFWEQMHHGLLQNLLSICVNLISLIFVNLYLGAFISIWSIIFIAIMYQLSKRMHKLASERTESLHNIYGKITDNIANILSIFAFTAKKFEKNNLEQYVSADFIPKEVTMYKYDFLIQLFAGLLYLILFFFILFFMIYLKINDLISIGDFALVFGLTLVTTNEIVRATYVLQEFARAMGDLRSSLSILQIQNRNHDRPNSIPLVINEPKISFKNVSFAYTSDKYVLNDLNLQIRAGEKIGLVGHSGAGKSTLVNLLLRYLSCTQGSIEISDVNINDVTEESLRAQASVIPQDILLFHRSIMENIRFGKNDALDEEVIAACKQAHIHDVIENMPEKYDSVAGERGLKISGGQRQRIAIARAILKNAPILILDEATSSLDSKTENMIKESLNLFLEDRTKTVIAIAHRLSTLKHMDRIVVLDKGRVVEEGTHEELIIKSDSLYKQLWDYQEI